MVFLLSLLMYLVFMFVRGKGRPDGCLRWYLPSLCEFPSAAPPLTSTVSLTIHLTVLWKCSVTLECAAMR